MSKAYRTIPADQVLGRLPAGRQARINLRAAQLIAQEVGLSELRKAKRVTQEQLAKRIGGRQVYISRFEKRSDVRLSKLREYVEALGGDLELMVTFPDRSAYTLGGYKGREEPSPDRSRRAQKPRMRPRQRPMSRA
jgi:transcriptional regulator with XRE-family HTH domain